MAVNQEKVFMITQINKILLFTILISSLISCNNNKDQELIPYVYVDVEINIDNQEYLSLRQDESSVNIVGGVEGILIYHKSGRNYRAFERNCPYKPSAECAKVEVDGSLLFIKCPCCTSQFGFDGSVLSGPAILPLKEYTSTLSGSYLRIQN